MMWMLTNNAPHKMFAGGILSLAGKCHDPYYSVYIKQAVS